MGPDFLQVETGHHLIKFFGQEVNLVFILLGILPQLYLGKYLVGERVTHHKAGMTGGTTKVYKASFCQHDNPLAVRKDNMVHLRFDILPLKITDTGNIDLRVKMTDVADNGLVLHLLHMGPADYAEVTGTGDKDITDQGSLFHGNDFIAFHGGLQGTDRIDLGYHDTGPHSAQGLGASLSHITVADHDTDLTGNHDICGPFDPVKQRFTAAIQVVKLGFCH